MKTKFRFAQLLGFISLVIAQLIFIGAAILIPCSSVIFLIGLIIIGALLFTSYPYFFKELEQKYEFEIYDSLGIIATVFGALLAYYISISLGLGAVIGSALVGTAGEMVFGFLKNKKAKALSLTLYCGSFVGMASTFVLSNYFLVALAGLLAGVLFVFTKNVFKGIGGKLGTLAFIGVLIISLIAMRVTEIDCVRSYDSCSFNTRRFTEHTTLSYYEYLSILVSSMIAAGATYYGNVRMKLGSVLPSAFLSLIIGVFFLFFPDVLGGRLNEVIPVVFIGASFIGMSSGERMETIGDSFAAGVIFAFLFSVTESRFVGFGGKLGTIAGISVIATFGIRMMIVQLKTGWDGRKL